MARHLAFLRAINLGSKRKFSKDAIADAVRAAGFTDVATHINTGNVCFETSLRSRAKIEAALESAFAEAAGFDVPTIAYTVPEFTAIAEFAASLDFDGRHYVSLLKQPPTQAASASLAAKVETLGSGERVELDGRAAHLLIDSDYHLAKLDNALIEKHLGVATNRNLTVVRALVEKWCS